MTHLAKIIILSAILIPVMILAAVAQDKPRICPPMELVMAQVKGVYPDSVFRPIPETHSAKYVEMIKSIGARNKLDTSKVVATKAMWVGNGPRVFVFFVRDDDTICNSLTMPRQHHVNILRTIFGQSS